MALVIGIKDSENHELVDLDDFEKWLNISMDESVELEERLNPGAIPLDAAMLCERLDSLWYEVRFYLETAIARGLIPRLLPADKPTKEAE